MQLFCGLMNFFVTEELFRNVYSVKLEKGPTYTNVDLESIVDINFETLNKRTNNLVVLPFAVNVMLNLTFYFKKVNNCELLFMMDFMVQALIIDVMCCFDCILVLETEEAQETYTKN